MIVQSPVVLEVPDHHRRRAAQGPREKNRGAGNPRNLLGFELGFDRVHELADWNEPLGETLCDHRRPAMPNQHDAIDNAGQKQRDISAVRDLHEIREEEAGIDKEECAGDRSACEQAPSPNLAHGNEQERRVQDQTWKDDARPGEPDRPTTEMPHVGIERFGPGHAEKDTAQNYEARVTVQQ
jgi:hypothetical protein